MPYMMGGFPDRETSIAVADAYAESGADLVELGIPFSDPLADGPVIQRATQRALAAGVTLPRVLELRAPDAGRGVRAARLPHVLQPDPGLRVKAFCRTSVEAGSPGRSWRTCRPRSRGPWGRGDGGRARSRAPGGADLDPRAHAQDRAGERGLRLHGLAHRRHRERTALAPELAQQVAPCARSPPAGGAWASASARPSRPPWWAPSRMGSSLAPARARGGGVRRARSGRPRGRWVHPRRSRRDDRGGERRLSMVVGFVGHGPANRTIAVR